MVAIHLALHVLGVGQDDEVIASSLTFIGHAPSFWSVAIRNTLFLSFQDKLFLQKVW